VQSQLVKQKLDAFSSLQELVDFNKNFDSIREKLVSDHHRLIDEEKGVAAVTTFDFRRYAPDAGSITVTIARAFKRMTGSN
jgi:hypothetical protein